MQYVNVSNQYVEHLKLTQCSMPIISQLKKKEKENVAHFEGAKDKGWAKKLVASFLVGVAMSEIYIYAHSIASK